MRHLRCIPHHLSNSQKRKSLIKLSLYKAPRIQPDSAAEILLREWIGVTPYPHHSCTIRHNFSIIESQATPPSFCIHDFAVELVEIVSESD
jgi:hypothetical protein